MMIMCWGGSCIIDTKPRPPLDEREKTLLADLATLAMDRLERRREERRRAQTEHRHASFASSSPNAVICTNGSGIITEWNAGAHPHKTAMFGYDADEAIGTKPRYHHSRRDAGGASCRHGAQSGAVNRQVSWEIRLNCRPCAGMVHGSGGDQRRALGRRRREGLRCNHQGRHATQAGRGSNSTRLAHFDPLTRIGNRNPFPEGYTRSPRGACPWRIAPD